MILALVVLACPCVVPDGLEERRAREDKLSPAAATGAQQMRTQAVSEVKALGARHAWAGEYDYYRDASGDAALVVSPSAGFVFESQECGEIVDRNVGAVAEEEGLLRLHPTYAESEAAEHPMATELLRIAWGARRYLVPPNELDAFCGAVNLGDEPWALQRRGGGAAAGLPRTEEGPLPCVLERPLWTRISGLGETVVRGFGDDVDAVTTVVTLAAGGRQGVREGMAFVVQATGAFEEQPLVVTDVGETSSQARLVIVGPRGTRLIPGVGWPVTSRRRLR